MGVGRVVATVAASYVVTAAAAIVVVLGASVQGSYADPTVASAEVFDPDARAWSSAGRLNAGRREGVLVRAPDGRRVLIHGMGWTRQPPPEAWDGKWEWTVVPPPPMPQGGALPVQLGDGASIGLGDELLFHDGKTARVVAKPEPKVRDARGVLLDDKRVLLVVQRFDDKTEWMVGGVDDWKIGGVVKAMPDAMARSRGGRAVAFLGEEVWLWSSDKAWERGPDCAERRRTPAIASLDDGRVLVAGGIGTPVMRETPGATTKRALYTLATLLVVGLPLFAAAKVRASWSAIALGVVLAVLTYVTGLWYALLFLFAPLLR